MTRPHDNYHLRRIGREAGLDKADVCLAESSNLEDDDAVKRKITPDQFRAEIELMRQGRVPQDAA